MRLPTLLLSALLSTTLLLATPASALQPEPPVPAVTRTVTRSMNKGQTADGGRQTAVTAND